MVFSSHVDLPRPVALFEAEHLPVVRHHVGVAGAPGEVTHAHHRIADRIRDVGGLDEAVSVPLGLAARETHAVHHAVTEEPMGRAA